MACVRGCPGNCIPADRTIKVNVGGYDLEWADVDMQKCAVAFRGAEPAAEGEEGKYFPHVDGYKASSNTPFKKKPDNVYITGQAVGGSAGCTRACMISLEKRGLLKNKFENPFRTSKPWKMDWSAEPFPVDYKAPYEDTDSPNAKVPVKVDDAD